MASLRSSNEVRDLSSDEFTGNVASGEDAATSQRKLRSADPVVDDYFHDPRLLAAVCRGRRHSLLRQIQAAG